MKRIISLLLIISMLLLTVFSAVSCSFFDDTDGGAADDNGGGEQITLSPDEGGEGEGSTNNNSQNLLKLIENGAPLFRLVFDASLQGTDVSLEYGKYITALRSAGIGIEVQSGNQTNGIQSREILIGSSFRGRGDLGIDRYIYGKDGYVIRVLDERVLIYGGSDEATCIAVNKFFKDYVGIGVEGTDLSDVSIPKDLHVENHPTYEISSLVFGGESFGRDYVIVADDHYETSSAKLLQDALYLKTGTWIDIVKSTDAEAEKRITFALTDYAGEEGYRVSLENGNPVFECAYYNSFVKGTQAFIDGYFNGLRGEVSVASDFIFTSNVSLVRYSDFGADVSGKTDSFQAIIDTHAFANECGQRVEADVGATYYIGHNLKSALIKTDTDWKDAEFIIDDREIPTNQRSYWVFRIVNDVQSYDIDLNSVELDLSKFKKGSTNIGLTFDEDKMLLIRNANKKVYIRYGVNQSSGDDQREVLLVDKDGNVSEITPFIWDYADITAIRVISVTDKPITVRGGVFTTRVNQQISKSNYYNRGISLERSNCTLYNVVHYLTDEPNTVDGSCPYTGFFYANNCYNSRFFSCVMTSHRTYKTTQADGDVVSQGNYDTQAVNCISFTWLNCTQTNDHNANKDSAGFELWGVMASNFSKNLVYDGCKLSRFDAHRGVYDLAVKNSEIGKVMNFVGSGRAYFENTVMSGGIRNYFLALRSDYGSTWEGDIVIKDCKLVSSSSSAAYAIQISWKSWDFGYPCYIPNVDIDGLEVVTKSGATVATSKVFLFNDFASKDPRNDSKNPLCAPSFIKTKNFAFADYVSSSKLKAVFEDTQKSKL